MKLRVYDVLRVVKQAYHKTEVNTSMKYAETEVDILSKMYTCEEIAERYSVQVITVWDWIRKKKLPAIKIGKSYRVREEDLKTFEDARLTTKTAGGE